MNELEQTTDGLRWNGYISNTARLISWHIRRARQAAECIERVSRQHLDDYDSIAPIPYPGKLGR